MKIICRNLLLALCTLSFSPIHAEQLYPNIEGDTIYEDDRVIIQSFRLEPGQWEGVHTHPRHQLVIVTNDSDKVISTFGNKEYVFINDEAVDTSPSAFWRPGPVTLEDQHNSGNLGTRTLEWIAITFKKESIAADIRTNETRDLVPMND